MTTGCDGSCVSSRIFLQLKHHTAHSSWTSPQLHGRTHRAQGEASKAAKQGKHYQLVLRTSGLITIAFILQRLAKNQVLQAILGCLLARLHNVPWCNKLHTMQLADSFLNRLTCKSQHADLKSCHGAWGGWGHVGMLLYR